MLQNFVLIVIFVLSILDLLLCKLYCEFRRRAQYTECTKQSQRESTSTVNQKKKNSLSIRKILGKIRRNLDPYLYGLMRYTTILIGKIPSHRCRKFLLKNVMCMTIDNKAVIYGGFEIRSPWNINIGKCVIGAGALLDGRNGIEIQDDVCLAQNVMIFTEQHDLNDPMFRCNDKGGKVCIENRAWISSSTVILPRVIVGEGAVLACGAVATKDLQAYGVYGGIPARKLSERNRDLMYHLENNNYWHFY